MSDVMVSRRWFIGGAASFGALAGCRAFKAPTGLFGSADDSGLRLTLGVVSDLHVDAAPGDYRKFGDAAEFEKALRWFDAQGADGVVVAGDMADNGMRTQLDSVGNAWRRVFPNDCGANGRHVEKLFVFGNHDIEGQLYDQFAVRYFDKKSFESQLICQNRRKAWAEAFDEEYADIWQKTVKGFRVVGAHWGKSWDGIPGVEGWFSSHAREIDPHKPFFYVQHPHPKGTCYGNDAWCPDAGQATRALMPFANAFAFSGHSHNSLTDERSIWQGAFTSVGTASLRYGGMVDKWEQRQGMLVRVYDDRVVLMRRDFLHEKSLGDDWVVPLPNAVPRPFTFAARKAKSVPPKFAADARLKVAADEKGWLIEIPCADAGTTRAFKYEIETGVKNRKGRDAVFSAWDAKYNMPRDLAGAPTKFLLKRDALALAEDGTNSVVPSKFTVYPVDSFGNRGTPIAASAAI